MSFSLQILLHCLYFGFHCSSQTHRVQCHLSHGWLSGRGMSPAEPTLDGSKDISVHDMSVSTEVFLNWVNMAYPSTAWGINLIFACCRGHMIDCTHWAICPGGRLFGPIAARYWRVVRTHKTCLSLRVILTSEVTDTTQVSIVAMARAPTWKPHAGNDGHDPYSCLHWQNHTSMVMMYQRWSISLMHWSSCLKVGYTIFLASYLNQGMTLVNRGHVNPLTLHPCSQAPGVVERLSSRGALQSTLRSKASFPWVISRVKAFHFLSMPG